MKSSVDQVVEHACSEQSTSLNLSHLNITVVPMRLCKAKHLLCLQLNNNRLIMPPEEVGDLDHLQELSLEHNQLTVLPSSLYRLSRLTYLNISYNPLGDLPLCVFYVCPGVRVFGQPLDSCFLSGWPENSWPITQCTVSGCNHNSKYNI